VTQYTHNSLLVVVAQSLKALIALVATQQATVLIKDIKDIWLSSQIKDIEDELGAVFKAYNETTKDKVDKVDKTELLELSAEEVTRIGLFTVPTL